MEEDVRLIMEENGITYPILHYTQDFDEYTTEYVPTTVFISGSGILISEEPYIGSQSYENWKGIIEDMFSRVNAS